MLINMTADNQLAYALKMCRTYRTIYGKFVIMLNGVVQVVIRYKD